MKTLFKKTITYILRTEARLVLWRYAPKIVAITGSVGKTSTKDAVYAVLSKFVHVRKSEKSYNSEIGLPLTILGVPNGWNNPLTWILNILKGLWLLLNPFGPHKYPKWLVLEVGVGKEGDMHATASWLKTDAVIITAIGETPAHIEFFPSRKHLIEEKSKLIKTLKLEGLLILNADDGDVHEMKAKTKNLVVTYGLKEGASVLGSSVDIFYKEIEKENNEAISAPRNKPIGVSFRVDEEGKSLPVFIEGVFGINYVYATLGALAFASGFKLNMLQAIDALRNYEVSPGRMRILEGIKDTLIIDDTYNSSPYAAKAGLITFGEIKCTGRKIAVLGDMLELGKHTTEAHKEIGKVAKDYADVLVVVGQRAKSIKEGAEEAGMPAARNLGEAGEGIFEFTDSTEAGKFLKYFVKSGDLIFVKGSQGMRMERAVEAILLDQKNKNKLLVRQDAEWIAKK